MEEKLVDEIQALSKKLTVSTGSSYLRRKLSYHTYPLLHNQAIYVVSLQTGALIYQRNILELLGYHEKEFTFESPFNLIHKEDYPIVKKIVTGSLKYAAEHGISEEAVLYINYRMRKKNGSYIMIQRASGICSVHKNKSLKANYSVIQDIDYLGIPNTIRWHWESPNVNRQEYRKYLKISAVDLFTPREFEIYQLIKKEFDNKLISNKLSLSINTVRSHKQNMFRKANCKTPPS